MEGFWGQGHLLRRGEGRSERSSISLWRSHRKDTSPVNKERTSSRAAQSSKTEHHSPLIRSRYNAHYFAKVNYLDSKNFGLAKIPKYYLQMKTYNLKSPEPFELEGLEDIVDDITNSHDATIPTKTTNNCAKLATLVDYPESPEELGDPNLDLALNNITMPHTKNATEI
ncbi:hypothetical protein E2562_018782 [Oryza meyeriana var. granulata]|uniref:Uncharacterized protein n=1 Tax=Oryza meyeriana var. granulata TaxID=110450 RepID=A0A6G1EXD2_9ORYZ|nr:hypothetical protein E2562_018782 [Oryza meyeriana var. granulata]